MNRDDIIRMAREAGISQAVSRDPGFGTFALLERFAALVAAAEREACADICDQYSEIKEINTAMAVAALNCSEFIRNRK